MSGILRVDPQPLESHGDGYERGSIKQRQNSEKARQIGTHPDEKKSENKTPFHAGAKIELTQY
ncbi:hypothetical protein N7509_008698 [Penicillium cosmopolitanum]|uniref:Uncharacterized protein n=1 Tax=Penicillium cosmopolitanum TaxID=1131564 RepID=A0A9W9VN51_9EURO|nr:uncharacterized protein N7509_008698 [Penicillium cosmopolitanum]KAJ5386157.1 hypothetical protein N7509_008698 [Penicillium cosmopolitanum]